MSGVPRSEYATLAYTYLHYVLIASIVVVAVGIEEAMAHVDSREDLGGFGAAALAVGIAVYLVGVTVLVRSAGRGWVWRRLVEAALLVALVPVLAGMPSLRALSLVVGVAYVFAIGARVAELRPRPGA
ncbi:low temperature requirement protein A [Cellulomonas edaphi]|uniref:Low temperature requirement protein A n=1 Tax=Cellulomonas edaphi TaxID=3053468 RepID=A0ABT7S5U9_9CELL|nr:low temperature requirement protein A [Cellulomons edaphi]MDM7830995.1 low temperature requirement protein A [Cellulomons edaphi]